jgi:hypothetical protein
MSRWTKQAKRGDAAHFRLRLAMARQAKRFAMSAALPYFAKRLDCGAFRRY